MKEGGNDMKNNILCVKRGDIYYADLRPVVGSEQGGVRPVLIVQNDIGNKFSPTTIVVPLTTRNKKSNVPTHSEIHKDINNGLKEDSIALCEQLRTIDKERLKNKVGSVDNDTVDSILNTIKNNLSML